jgi:DNA processing protein
LEANREVFAVPGSVFSEHSQGTNGLLQAGAHLAINTQDILNVFGLEAVPAPKLSPATTQQLELLQHLSAEPTHLDELVRQSQLSTADCLARLTLLELAGYVREVGGQTYVRLG